MAAFLLSLSQAAAEGTITGCNETSLRRALAGGGIVNLDCDGVIVLTNTIFITNHTFLQATGRVVNISGGGRTRLFVVASNMSLSLNHLTLSSGQANGTNPPIGEMRSSDGGAIYNNHGVVTLLDTVITGHAALGAAGQNGTNEIGKLNGFDGDSGRGGGIFNNAGVIFLTASTISSNKASGGKGGNAFTSTNGAFVSPNGGNGGSGGGHGGANGNNATAGGLGTAGQGNNGGSRGGTFGMGGGGGAGSAGSNGGVSGGDSGGTGGAGLASSISGSPTFYAGGGGGSGRSVSGGAGGVGGGGSGPLGNSNGSAATPNTGGGGGGGGDQGTTGGPGGSGIVIIRYAICGVNYAYSVAASKCILTPTVPANGLLVRWKLDEGSGTSAADSSGSGLNGTLSSTTWQTNTCKFGACARFDGTGGSHLSLASSLNTAGSGATFATWVQLDPATTGTYQTLFNGPYTSCCTARLLIDGSLHPFWDAGMYSDQSLTGYTFPLGQWLHVVWTIVAGGNATLYVNGTQVAQTSAGVPGTFPSLPNFDVATADSFQWPAKGLFNDVLVYNRAFSMAEVTSLYQLYGSP